MNELLLFFLPMYFNNKATSLSICLTHTHSCLFLPPLLPLSLSLSLSHFLALSVPLTFHKIETVELFPSCPARSPVCLFIGSGMFFFCLTLLGL